MSYHSDYPNEPIGGGSPYYRCTYCKRSDPDINGRLEGHEIWCEYRQEKEDDVTDLQRAATWRLDMDESAIYHDDKRVMTIEHGPSNHEWREACQIGAEIVERLNAAPRRQPLEHCPENEPECSMNARPVSKELDAEIDAEIDAALAAPQPVEMGIERLETTLPFYSDEEIAALAAPQPAPMAGSWVAADDVSRMARKLDVAMNGEGAAAKPSLCDVIGQAVAMLAAPQPEQEPCEDVAETNAILAGQYFDLLRVVEAYEKSGVTCQTYRHFVDAPCAECNCTAPQAPRAAQPERITKEMWRTLAESQHEAQKAAQVAEGIEQALAPPQPSPIKLSSDGAAAVNPDTFWIPITKENMPIEGARYLLINRKAGVAFVTQFKNDGWWTHYAGLPKFKD